MTQDITGTKISAFWQWFIEQEDTIKDFFSDESETDKDKLVEEMNQLILDLGRFAWEIGEEGESGFYLIISPNGDRDLLALSKRIMAASPPLSAWNLYPAKPAKSWDWKLRLYDDFLREHEVDASGWSFILQSGPEGRVELLFEAANLHFFDAETQRIAAETAVNFLLGEEMRILHVRKIAVLPELGEGQQEGRQPIRMLREAFELTRE